MVIITLNSQLSILNYNNLWRAKRRLQLATYIIHAERCRHSLRTGACKSLICERRSEPLPYDSIKDIKIAAEFIPVDWLLEVIVFLNTFVSTADSIEKNRAVDAACGVQVVAISPRYATRECHFLAISRARSRQSAPLFRIDVVHITISMHLALLAVSIESAPNVQLIVIRSGYGLHTRRTWDAKIGRRS